METEIPANTKCNKLSQSSFFLSKSAICIPEALAWRTYLTGLLHSRVTGAEHAATAITRSPAYQMWSSQSFYILGKAESFLFVCMF